MSETSSSDPALDDTELPTQLSPADRDPELSRAHATVKQRLFGIPQHAAKIDRFTLLESVGGGGMGVVYAAYDPELDRKIAVKLLRNDAGSSRTPSEAHRTRMVREAQAMAKVNHPNVITVHEVGVHDEQVFVAMEFVHGQTLRDWLDAEDRTWMAIRDAFVEIAKGLAAAHAVGLVHRDFKPDNVMITDDGRVLVLDFGLAKRVDADPDSLPPTRGAVDKPVSSRLTQTGAVLGTPAYMAPEQHLGDRVDARADQFAFCVALWEALYGARPFSGADYTSLAKAVIEGDLTEPDSRGDVPAQIDRAVRKGLATAPDDRFTSMGELVAELSHDPGVGRRKMVVGAAVLAAVGGIGFGLFAELTDEPDPECAAEQRRLTATWNGTRRDRVATAFVATERPYAQDVFDTVARDLDGYAKRWSSVHAEACEAEPDVADEDTSDATARLQTRLCLDHRRLELESLVDLFENPDGAVVEHAVEAVDALSPISQCTTDAATGTTPRLPDDDATRAAVLEQRTRLAQARSLGAAGRHRDAIATAQLVQARAAELDYPPLQAEAALAVGRLQAAGSDLRSAEVRATAALWRALSCEHDVVAVESAKLLVHVVGWERADFDGALPWMRLAQALVERPPLRGLAPRVQLEVGAMFLRAGRHPEALEYFGSAAEQIESRDGEASAELAESLVWLGAGLSLQARFDEASEALSRALTIRRAALGPEHTAVAEVLVRLGELEWKRGVYERAREHYAEALAIAEQTQGRDHPATTGPLAGLARTAWALRDDEAAEAAAKRVLDVHRSGTVEDAILVSTLETLAHVERRAGRMAASENALKRANAVALRHGAEHPLNTFVLYGRAELKREGGEPDKALAYLEQARNLARDSVGVADPRWFELLVATGRAYLDDDAAARAVDPLQRAVSGLSRCCQAHFRLPDAELALARALQAMGREPDRVRTLARSAAERFTSDGRTEDATAARELATAVP